MGRKAGEKWPTGERMLAMTRELLAFPDATVQKAGEVLTELLDCEDPKERRLAAERIRDERGLTRIVKPTEQHHLHVSIDPSILALAQQHRRPAKSIDVRAARVDSFGEGPRGESASGR
jgi:hypothetical protein